MKTCTKCFTSKSFDNYSKSRGKYQSWCKPCVNAYSKKRHSSSPEIKARKLELQKLIYKRNQQFIWDYLSSHPCIDCGESDPIVLEFDHRGDKSFNISEGPGCGFSIEKISKEIAKCDIRCSNCHRRKTAKTRGYYSKMTLRLNNE